jgi:exodeoxyribonuclease V alpha subunit
VTVAFSGLVAIEHVILRGRRMIVFRGDDVFGHRRRYAWRHPTRPPCVGEVWQIDGEVVQDPAHGEQVRVDAMAPARPRGQFLRRLLAGERFPGVGVATANRLCDGMTTDQLVSVLAGGDRHALEAVLGDGSRARAQIDTMLIEWPLVDGEADLLAWFDQHAVPPGVAAKALACYGADARDLIIADPYRLLAFAGWRSVDPIAFSIGITAEDPRRFAAAVEAACHDHLASGSTLISEDVLERAVNNLLGREDGRAAIDLARRHKAVVQRAGGWQAAGPALMEEAVAERIADELTATPRATILALAQGLTKNGPDLNVEQRAAVQMALERCFLLVTGGAGTGKTTLLAAVHRAATEAGMPVEMMALSGRAALRIREATGAPARTIAGWLGLLDRGRLKPDGAPLIVIDEASMVDLGSLHRILRGAPDGARFLLVGDDGQLPPVGFGLTFHALLEVPAIPRVHLTEVMRQAADTGIPAFAAALRRGELLQVQPYDPNVSTGVSLASCSHADVAVTAASIRRGLSAAQIVGSIKGRDDPSTGGTKAMNGLLHSAWIEAKSLSPGAFARGEPVMWTVNDYDLELWNGSLGRVIGPVQGGLAVAFDEGERVIPAELLNNLELAWAITTHKAQGSSFDTVIVPVTRSRIYDRTLLYTAVTRARRRVILVGEIDAIVEVVSRPPQASRRATWLRQAVEAAVRAKTDEIAWTERMPT